MNSVIPIPSLSALDLVMAYPYFMGNINYSVMPSIVITNPIRIRKIKTTVVKYNKIPPTIAPLIPLESPSTTLSTPLPIAYIDGMVTNNMPHIPPININIPIRLTAFAMGNPCYLGNIND